MVKTTGACFSLEASGSLARAITYQKTYGARIVRKIPIPKYSRSPGQNSVRLAQAKAVQYWHLLTAGQQATWKAYSDPNGNNGYHAFMSQFIKRTLTPIWQYNLPPNTGYCLVGEWLVAEVVVAGEWQDP